MAVRFGQCPKDILFSSDAWNHLLGPEKGALSVLEGIILGVYSGGSKCCGGPTRIRLAAATKEHDRSTSSLARQLENGGGRMTRFLTFAAFALLPLLARGEGYNCIEDKVTGFAYRNGEWRERNFKPDHKFIVRRPIQRDRTELSKTNAKWVIVWIGTEYPTALCPDDFDAQGSLVCRNRYDEFRINKSTLRFLYADLFGYWSSTDSEEERNTTTIAIGKCSPM
jgi:hypothetical protein